MYPRSATTYDIARNAATGSAPGVSDVDGPRKQVR